VIVRNLVTEYGGRDGFASGKGEGIVFEDIEARYYMDQGISNHGGNVVVRRGYFHHNAGAGIVDVYDDVVVRYEDCVIEHNTWRAGVELLDGKFEMIRCVIRGNPSKGLLVSREATVHLEDCFILAGEGGGTDELGIRLAPMATLSMERCTVAGFDTPINATLSPGGGFTMRRSALIANDRNLEVTLRAIDSDKPVTISDFVNLEGNAYTAAPFQVRVISRDDAGERRIDTQNFSADEHAGFAQVIGSPSGEIVDIAGGNATAETMLQVSTSPGDAVGAPLSVLKR